MKKEEWPIKNSNFDFLVDFEKQISKNEKIEKKWDQFVNWLNSIKIIPNYEEIKQIINELGIKIKEEWLEHDGEIRNIGEQPLIVINFKTYESIKKFTLFHELAHYFFDYDMLINNTTLQSNSTNHKISDKVEIIKREIRADKFADEILLPEDLLLKSYFSELEKQKKDHFNLINNYVYNQTFIEIAKHFKVTRHHVTNRLLKIGMIE